MAVFYSFQEFEGFTFRFIVDRDTEDGQVVVGLVLTDDHPFDGADYLRALNTARHALRMLKQLYAMGEEAIGFMANPGTLHSYTTEQLELIADEFDRLLNRQRYWIPDEQNEADLKGGLEVVRAELQRRSPPPIPTPTSRNPGYVYLLQSPTGAYKIGRTINPANRLKTFTVKLPFEVEYICTIKTPDMVALEQELHARFASKRINGEWFALNDEDIAYIKGLAAP